MVTGTTIAIFVKPVFGGEFGAFESRQRHFFDETHPVYLEVSRILQLRRENLVIRRGRQYLREISGDGINFGLPRMVGGVIRSIVPWSRIFNDSEVLLAINTDFDVAATAWVTIDNALHAPGEQLTCLYSTDSGQSAVDTCDRGTQWTSGSAHSAACRLCDFRVTAGPHTGLRCKFSSAGLNQIGRSADDAAFASTETSRHASSTCADSFVTAQGASEIDALRFPCTPW